MTALERWLEQATRHLAKDSAGQVRAEIQEHYDAAREVAIRNGATEEEAERLAVGDLGDARTANCQYRRVLLTRPEARLLREGNWEARAVCSRPWLKWTFLVVPAAAFYTATALFLKGSIAGAWVWVAGGIGLLLAAPLLPIYTPSRGRGFRVAKWVVMLSLFGMVFGSEWLKWSWLLISCLWPMAWVEWTRVSIRRKLPVAQWPKQLYL